MKIESYIRILAGSMVILSVALSHFHSPYWLFLTLFVGFNLIQSAFTGFCPPEMILRKLGVGKGSGSGCGCTSDDKECCK